MIFSELYSAYYNAVASVLREACRHPLSPDELRRIAAGKAFRESVINIEPALREERWQLLKPDGTTPIRYAPVMPLTTLQKRWLKAITLDPRIRLFGDSFPSYPEVEPLFRPEDVLLFDRYTDGDPYRDEAYIRHFRMILEAIRTKTPLDIESANRKGKPVKMTLIPEYLEYSEKDDKFRLIAAGRKNVLYINLGRIMSCRKSASCMEYNPNLRHADDHAVVEMELFDQRNALERVLMHFAHFEKQAEKIDEDRYRVTITYDQSDETEMVIRILSFGPMIKVSSPPHFVDLIKERLLRQKSCGL